MVRRRFHWACRLAFAAVAVFAVVLGLRGYRDHKSEADIRRVLRRGGVVLCEWQLDRASMLNSPAWIPFGMEESCSQRVVRIRVSASDADDLRAIAVFRHLKILHLEHPGSMGLVDLSPLSKLCDLEELSLAGCEQLSDLTPLAALTKLERLDLEATDVCDLSPLKDLRSLQELNLTNTKVKDLSPLGSLPNLRRISLWGAGHVDDLSPLVALDGLHTLDITSMRAVDVASLVQLRGLRELRVYSKQLTEKEVAELVARLPDCNIIVAP